MRRTRKKTRRRRRTAGSQAVAEWYDGDGGVGCTDGSEACVAV